MTNEPRQIYTRAAGRKRPRRRLLASLLAILVIVAVLVWAASKIVAGSSHDGSNGTLTIMRAGSVLAMAPASQLKAMSEPELRDWVHARVPRTRVERRANTRITLAASRSVALADVKHALARAGGQVMVRERPVAARIRLRVVRQALRNNCETASLSMLLRADGIRAKQLDLQRRLRRSGPLDPHPSHGGDLPTWGDPEKGFVGRAAGGGTAGGYGVYERPIAALARARGADLHDLSRGTVSGIYTTLLSGHAVMAWVGLSNGPYKSWRGPAGELVRVNLGEHVVVLTGLRGRVVYVNDPLSGKKLTWSKGQFEAMWGWLGHRALAA